MPSDAGVNSTALDIRLAGAGDSNSWDDYVNSHADRTLSHRWGWSEILANSFHLTPEYHIARRAGRIVGVYPAALMKSALFGRFVISLPWLDYGGPLADSPQIARDLMDRVTEVAREHNCRFVENRAVRSPLDGLTNKTDKREFLLDLTAGEEAVWMAFDAKARNQVRKGQKAGLDTSFGGVELLDDLYAVFSRNMRDLGTPVWPRTLFTEILRVFPEDSEIVTVIHDNKVIAAGLLLHYGAMSMMPSASSYREYRALCPNNVLYWETIRHCLKRGSRSFDFGRSTYKAGTYQFKKQWVKNPVPQSWQYRLLTIDDLPELNPNNPRFKLAIAIWRKLPLFMANYLGPKIVTKLP